MLTLISFILILVGAINWFCIGLLQFDFVAGLFGSQSSIFSRFVYVVIGVSSFVILFNLIKNKGKIKFNFKHKEKTTSAIDLELANSKAEASEDFVPKTPKETTASQKPITPPNVSDENSEISNNTDSSENSNSSNDSNENNKQETYKTDTNTTPSNLPPVQP